MIRKKVWFFPADGNTGELQQEISAVFNSLFFNWRLMLCLLAEARRKGLHYIRLTSANSALQVLSVAWIFILKVEREYCSSGRSQMTNRSCWLKRFANQFFCFHYHQDLEVPYPADGPAPRARDPVGPVPREGATRAEGGGRNRHSTVEARSRAAPGTPPTRSLSAANPLPARLPLRALAPAAARRGAPRADGTEARPRGPRTRGHRRSRWPHSAATGRTSSRLHDRLALLWLLLPAGPSSLTDRDQVGAGRPVV